jgi:cytochrome c oxidase subunit 2
MFDRTHRLRRGAVGAVTVLVAAGVLASCGGGNDNGQNSLQPAGPESHKIFNLFTPFFWVAAVIGVGVVGATIFVALRFREKPGEERSPVQVHGNSVLEISWTIVPAVILAVMAVFTIPVIFQLNDKPTGKDVIHIKVTGRQWYWEYQYQNQDEKFFTATEMHIPVNRPIAMDITAPRDGVIHSFWIPELNGKKDAVPGHDDFLKFEADKPGIYLGQCAEYCGLSHADMRMRVIAQSESDYETWVANQKQALDATQKQFVQTVLGDGDPAQNIKGWGCIACHSFDPISKVEIGPNLTHVGDRTTFAGGIYDLNASNLALWVHNAPSRKPMGDLEKSRRMPNFSAQGMTMDQAHQIAEFLCNTATTQAKAQQCLSGTGGLSTGLNK